MIKTTEDIVNPKTINLPKDYNPNKQKLDDMIESLKLHGMLHPPIIKENRDIVTGKLRVAASQYIPEKYIKVLICDSNLTEDEDLELSLHENLKRGNLSWDEIVIKEKELHELRLRQNGITEAIRGKRADWGLRETAQELNISLGSIAEDLQLATAILLDPSLRRVKDKQTAKRVIKENIKRSRQESGVTAPTNAEVNICHLGDSSVILRLYPDNMFDACLTDPPWLEFKDPNLTRDEFTLPVFKEVYRVLKANSFLYALLALKIGIIILRSLLI